MEVTTRLFAVRGAVCCENTEESIQTAVNSLYEGILAGNGITEGEIVSVQFTITTDLDALNPATALRLAGNAADVPLFVSSEPDIKNSLARTVRVLILFYGRVKPSPLYLNGAESLRPDLASRKRV